MTSESNLDLTFEQAKVSKRALKPKLLKLTDMAIPHRSRKKTKVKIKERPAISVRERIYDDPAYTDDISHLANPLRRNSCSSNPMEDQTERGRINQMSSNSLGSRNRTPKELLKTEVAKQNKIKSVGKVTGPEFTYDLVSSSSDNEQLDRIKCNGMIRRGRSLERCQVTPMEKSDKKAAHRSYSKQKRNLSLDSSQQGTQKRQLRIALTTRNIHDYEIQNSKAHSRGLELRKYINPLASVKNDQDDVYSTRSSATTVPIVSSTESVTAASETQANLKIGRRLLRGEIGIKSFNYYLLKEGLKSSKKFVEKQRNIVTADSLKESSARSEENIYEEIFFKDTQDLGSTALETSAKTTIGHSTHNKKESSQLSQRFQQHAEMTDTLNSQGEEFPDCEICMQQCNKGNCDYCVTNPTSNSNILEHVQPEHQTHKQKYQKNIDRPLLTRGQVEVPSAHILEFQSYNPNNPGVYKIETTPVAITGEYNPILQFQQSSTKSTSSSEAQQLQFQVTHKQKQQELHGDYYQPPRKVYESNNFIKNHFVSSGGLLFATAAETNTIPRDRAIQQSQQQHFLVSYKNGNAVQNMNAKSSSSSDSLQHHKHSTRPEADMYSAPTSGDLYYAITSAAPFHPLMNAACRPIGGSQILVDHDAPQMYKSDSKASILSEYSLRSSDNSQRFAWYPYRNEHRYGGQVSDSSLLSAYTKPLHRRKFGSTESCNCDCSSSYFSSDFDDMYGSGLRSGIPRKTAAGTLPSSTQIEHNVQDLLPTQLDLKQNKYALDFFKHVNDVKRSIYQSEMQRNYSLESKRSSYKISCSNSPNSSQNYTPKPVITTLPLSKGRGSTIIAPSLRKRLQEPHLIKRREYPSLDRLTTTTTGTVPKSQNRSVPQGQSRSPRLKSKHKETKLQEHRDQGQHQVSPVDEQAIVTATTSTGKRQYRSTASKTLTNSTSSGIGCNTRRKDIPAPPPPSPATYSDIQELKANMEGLQDDTKGAQNGIFRSQNKDLCAIQKSSTNKAEYLRFPESSKPVNTAGQKTVTNNNLSGTVQIDIPLTNKDIVDTIGTTTVISSSTNSIATTVFAVQTVISESKALPPFENKEEQKGNDKAEYLKQQLTKSKANQALSSTAGDKEQNHVPDHEQLIRVPVPQAQLNEQADITNYMSEETSKPNVESKTATDWNADATCMEGQQSSFSATNVASRTSVIINAALESSATSCQLEVGQLADLNTSLAYSVQPVVSTVNAIITNVQSNSLPCQENICIDSSEVQSDDSQLTRDSGALESQNDELSSSTHDKIDVSTLPLPELPTKRRRIRSRGHINLSNYQQQNQQHQYHHKNGESVSNDPTIPQQTHNQKLYDASKEITAEDLNISIENCMSTAAQRKQKHHLSALQEYVAKRRESLEASTRSFDEKLEARKVQARRHLGGSSDTGESAIPSSSVASSVPTYIFGEHRYGNVAATLKPPSSITSKEEIYLNKSGWVQVNTKRSNDSNRGCSHYQYGQNDIHTKLYGSTHAVQTEQTRHSNQMHHRKNSNLNHTTRGTAKFVGSKVEELIVRNETRLSGISSRGSTLRPGYRIIDPQLANILNERPGFLPVKRNNDLESPPPNTPILSPPPAFQDNGRTHCNVELRKPSRQANVLESPMALHRGHPRECNAVKGMVFSRSFEYDPRRRTPTDNYVETFSRSFDGNLSERPKPSHLAVQRRRSPNFSTLTGNSPNYLTKREGGGSSGSPRSRDSSPKYNQPKITAYLNTSVKEAPPTFNIGSSSQDKYLQRSCQGRSFERTKSHNGLDRSRKSQFTPIISSTRHTNVGMSRFSSLDTRLGQRLNSCDSGARSDLSNDELENDDDESAEFLSTSNYQFSVATNNSVSVSPHKAQCQTTLTPDKNEFQSSTSSLQRQHRKRHEDKTPLNISRSSSSSSYSGGDNHDFVNGSAATSSGFANSSNTQRRISKQSEQEHRVRRSRSLQLSERSPNRVHKSIINVGGGSVLSQQQKQHLSPQRSMQTQSQQQSAIHSQSHSVGTNTKMLTSSDALGLISAATVMRHSDVEKSRSFDFDYNIYHSNNTSHPSHNSGSGGDSGTNQNQSTGSSSNNLHLPSRQTTSPQSYGSRLCDHELTYGILRKSLDRSPLFFHRGDSNEFEQPIMIRNRETINSGGNTELNFMSNDTHNFALPNTVPNKPQQTQREKPGSRDDLTMEVSVGVGGDYIYRQKASSQHRSSSLQLRTEKARATTKSCRQDFRKLDYQPCCCACANKVQQKQKTQSMRCTENKPLNSIEKISHEQSKQRHSHVSTVVVNGAICKPDICIEKAIDHHTKSERSQWIFLCSGGIKQSIDQVIDEPSNVIPIRQVLYSSSSQQIDHNGDKKRGLMAIVRPRVKPLLETTLVTLGNGHIPCYFSMRSNSHNDDNVATQQDENVMLSEMGSKKQTNENNYNSNDKKKEIPTDTVKNNLSNAEIIDSIYKDTSQWIHEKKYSHLKRRHTIIGLPMIKDADSTITNENGPIICLTQQMHAISSPLLMDITPQQLILKETAPILAVQPEITNETTNTNACLMQNRKHTFGNFHSQNQRLLPALPTTKNGIRELQKSNSHGSAVEVPVTIPVSKSDDVPESRDVALRKQRFGALVWRSSKERRTVKYNRHDKCNSGDSGIQVEIEQDERFGRTLVNRNRSCLMKTASKLDQLDVQAQTIHRSNSTKACGVILQRSITADNSKLILKNQLDFRSDSSIEREASLYLPRRSLSHPNGLDTVGTEHIQHEDSDSDSVSSHEEACRHYSLFAEVLYNFNAAGPQELALKRGTLVEILRKEAGPWWFGRLKKDVFRTQESSDPEHGWFPKEFVRILNYPQNNIQKVFKAGLKNLDIFVPVDDFNHTAEESSVTMTVDQKNITTIIIQSPQSIYQTVPLPLQLNSTEILRRNVVRELLDTEVNYVKLLGAICNGYMPAMGKRIDIFSEDSISLIFSNIATIFKFQQKFLDTLRKGIEQNQLSKVFLKMHKGFLCYSTYCNAYPRALIELESYERIKDARTILENCRENENLAELPLSAHLLAPVQRICRYPLHLNEILKTISSGDHSDKSDNAVHSADLSYYEQLNLDQLDMPDTIITVNSALEAMRRITEAVNEGKRHSETISRHEATFQNFKGPSLHIHSTRFFLQIDATRQKQNLWNSSYTLFLFDNQLIYCKRDLIKRSQFIYKGRIILDRCRIINVRDGKMFGHTIKNSLRIYSEFHDKWYDFSFRSANRKQRFLNTLALERQFGGKAMHISEITDFVYNNEEHTGDCSDQSDYESPLLNGENVVTLISGNSSVGDSPAKSLYRNCDTLPNKSHVRNGICSAENIQTLSSSTGSLGRRRLGNWFRKPKTTNCTPSQSPTHKPNFDAEVTLTAARLAAMELVRAEANRN